MKYEPGSSDHGLPWDPFKSCVVPRPIGWISSLSEDGIPNLAPYSQFQNLGFNPPYVMYSANPRPDGRKHSVTNAENTREFVWNLATYDLRDAVNKSAQEVDADVDEFDLAGVTKAPCDIVAPFRVAESPVNFECVFHTSLRLPGNGPGGLGSADIVIGRVVMIHINDDYIGEDGKLDIPKYKPLARMGYYDYTAVENVFTINHAGGNRPGMEGRTGTKKLEGDGT